MKKDIIDTVRDDNSETFVEDSAKEYETLLKEINLEMKRVELSKRRGELRDLDINRFYRERYIDRLFILMVSSLALSWIFVFLSGVTWCPFSLRVPSEVLIALLGTTTVEVIGLFVLVVKYMFTPPFLQSSLLPGPQATSKGAY